MTASPAPVAKPSAVRMRRHRERAKLGAIFVRFEMTPAAVDRLIPLKWLQPECRRDRDAVINAFLKFGTAGLWPEQ
jgi:hypothetical protein